MRYPAIPLAAARDTARRTKEEAELGIDPREVKRALKAEDVVRRSNTFAALGAEFIESYAIPNLRPSTVREYKRALQGRDTAHLSNIPVSDISKRDIMAIIDRMVARGSAGAAGRTLAYLGKFFSWCMDREVLNVSPADRLRAPQATQSRERVLSRDELQIVWDAFEADSTIFGPLFKLLLLTGQRRSEVAGMRWDELEGLSSEKPIWRIPSSRTKNRLSHLVPLSPGVTSILRGLPHTGELIFSTNGKRPVSGFGKAKSRIDAWIEANYAILSHWTLHDLRRTMVTVMNEELRIPPHVVEAVVNHVSGSAKRGVAGVYNRALYIEERRNALDRWAEHLLAVSTQLRKDRS